MHLFKYKRDKELVFQICDKRPFDGGYFMFWVASKGSPLERQNIQIIPNYPPS